MMQTVGIDFDGNLVLMKSLVIRAAPAKPESVDLLYGTLQVIALGNPLCNLRVLCASVVTHCPSFSTTEAQRTQRRHREKQKLGHSPQLQFVGFSAALHYNRGHPAIAKASNSAAAKLRIFVIL